MKTSNTYINKYLVAIVLNTMKEKKMTFFFNFVNVCSVAKLYLNLSNPMGYNPLSFTNSPGFCVNSCPLSWWCYLNISSLSLPSPPALHLSQHQGLFWWVGSSHQVAKYRSFSFIYLPMNIQGWFPFGLTGLFSLLPKRVSSVFSSTTKSIISSMLSLLYGLTPHIHS